MKSNDDAKHFHSKAVLSCHSIEVLYTVLLLWQFDICILFAPHFSMSILGIFKILMIQYNIELFRYNIFSSLMPVFGIVSSNGTYP